MTSRDYVRAAVIASCAAAAGCRSPSDDVKPPEQKPKQKIHYEVGVAPQAMVPPAGISILAEGKDAGRVLPKSPYVRVDLDDDVWLFNAGDTLKAKLDTTCGLEEVALRGPYKDRDEEQRMQRDLGGDTHWVVMRASTTKTAFLWVDNVGGAKTTMTIGKQTIDIPEDGTWQGYVRTGSCAEARSVSVGGKVIGDVTASDNPDQVTHDLVDLGGNHCYRLRTHVYAESTLDLKAPADKKLQGQRVYVVDAVQDFLIESPTSVEVWKIEAPRSPQEIRERVELNRCTGTPKRKK